MEIKKISVIIPVYNLSEYIDECIQSVINQSYTNIEIIVVDDGSTDDSVKKISGYLNSYKNIKLIEKDNGGVSSARNCGLDNASGDYIAFVDGDDWLDRKYFEEMMNRIEQNDASICTNNMYIRDENKVLVCNIDELNLNFEKALKYLLTYRLPTSVWSSIYKKEVLKDIRFNLDIHHLEDLEFQFRAIANASRITVLNKALYNYRSREGSANSQKLNSKILSCLLIPNTILKFVKKNKILSKKYYFVTLGRVSSTIAFFLSKTKKTDRVIKKKVIKYSRKSLLPSIFSNIPLKKKILLLSISISFNLYYKLNTINQKGSRKA